MSFSATVIEPYMIIWTEAGNLERKNLLHLANRAGLVKLRICTCSNVCKNVAYRLLHAKRRQNVGHDTTQRWAMTVFRSGGTIPRNETDLGVNILGVFDQD